MSIVNSLTTLILQWKTQLRHKSIYGINYLSHNWFLRLQPKLHISISLHVLQLQLLVSHDYSQPKQKRLVLLRLCISTFLYHHSTIMIYFFKTPLPKAGQSVRFLSITSPVSRHWSLLLNLSLLSSDFQYSRTEQTSTVGTCCSIWSLESAVWSVECPARDKFSIVGCILKPSFSGTSCMNHRILYDRRISSHLRTLSIQKFYAYAIGMRPVAVSGLIMSEKRCWCFYSSYSANRFCRIPAGKTWTQWHKYSALSTAPNSVKVARNPWGLEATNRRIICFSAEGLP